MIDSFRGDNRWLSNFGAGDVWYEGREYPTREHAYQAAKTYDPDLRLECAALSTPGKAQRWGQKIELIPDWEWSRTQVMRTVVRNCFLRHESLREKLQGTGNQFLVERNTWGDTFWGVCAGNGRNRLGQILMDLREELTSRRTRQ